MSLNHIIKATCPECKKEFPFEVWQSVNVQLNPEMREKVLDGSIFSFSCPHCGIKGHTEYQFLYNDMKHGFMIQFCPDEDSVEECKNAFENIVKNDVATGVLNNSYLRIVTHYFQLVEKIKIFESGYDDRLIELLKAREIKDLNHKKSENHLALAFFDLRTHKHVSPKNPVPTLVYINEDGEEAFECPISIIPGAVGQIKDNYNYLDDTSFVIDAEWADRYVYSEKISSNLFDVEFDKNSISEEGTALASKLMKLIKNDENKKKLQDALEQTESQAVEKAACSISSEQVFDALKAFYRYTNFNATLEAMKDNPKFPWRDQIGFYFDKIDMNEFYTEYFNITQDLFGVLPAFYVKALIHGAKFDPNFAFDFSVESRDRTSLSVYWSNQLTGTKKNDSQVYKAYYKEHEGDTWALSAKNMCVRYIYQFDLPEDDLLRFKPLVTDSMWKAFESRSDRFYDIHNPPTEADKEKTMERNLKQILEIWKVSFTKYDIGRCFEEIASYFYTKAFYDNELYRKVYINQVISSAYRPDHFGMMYIKKQYKDEISPNEFRTYEIETGLPTSANKEIEELIMNRYKECKEKEDMFGQVYYLNLLYNYYDENAKEALAIDSMLTELLRKIEL